MADVGELFRHQAMRAGMVDVAILDVQLADRSEPEDNVRGIRDAGVPVLLYTQDTRLGVVAKCLQAGAMGIVNKREAPSVLVDAARAVARGEPFMNADWASALAADVRWAVPNLAPREVEALRLYATGLLKTSVARRMGIREATVDEYLTRIRRKYQASGRPIATKLDLYLRALEDGYIPPHGQ